MSDKLKTCMFGPGMKWRQSCLEEAKEKFAVRVDWDVDHMSAEGCHGKDFFSKDDPVRLEFSIFANGGAFIKGFGVPFLLTPDNRLLWLNKSCEESYTIMAKGRFPRLTVKRMSPKPEKNLTQEFTFTAFSANRAFYKCYQSSKNLNSELTHVQKLAVERFFVAVRRMFPRKYERTN